MIRMKEYGAISRVGISGNVSAVERLSYQSEARSPKRFSVRQWIEENEVCAKRVHAFPFDGISILRNKNIIVSRSKGGSLGEEDYGVMCSRDIT